MTLCQRTNAGVAAEVARWLDDHDADLILDGPDHRMRYLLAVAGDGAPVEVGRFRTVHEFAMAAETPGAIAWS